MERILQMARESFKEVSSIEDIFIPLQISASKYEAALSISEDNDFRYILRGPQILVL